MSCYLIISSHFTASNGLKLVPKLETISLMDTLCLPMKVMRDMQTKIEIQLRPISKEICSHIITGVA